MKEQQRKTAEQRAIEKLTELNTEEGQETIIRFGDALPLKEPKAVSISGTIDAPARWVEKRKDDIVSADAHVLVDRDHMSITLKTDENSAYSNQIVGVLTLYAPQSYLCMEMPTRGRIVFFSFYVSLFYPWYQESQW